MTLINGSDDYWMFRDYAERIYRFKSNADFFSERKEFSQKGRAFADKLIAKYGEEDREVVRLIERYGLYQE